MSFVKLSVLKKELSKAFAALESAYEKVLNSDEKTPFDKELRDNFFKLECAFNGIDFGNKRAMIYVDENFHSQIGTAIFDSCNRTSTPYSKKIIEIFEEILTEREISNDEFALADSLFRYELIRAAAELTDENESHNHSISELCALIDCNSVLADEIVFSVNPIEKIFSSEPSGIYLKSDFETRRNFCAKCAEISFLSGISEKEVALKALYKARKAFNDGISGRLSHIGHYIDESFNRLHFSLSPQFYAAILVLFSTMISLLLAYKSGYFLLFFAFYFPVHEIVKCLLDAVLTHFSKGYDLPAVKKSNAKTIVAVSTIITEPKDAQKLENKLSELYYLTMGTNIFVCAICDYLPSKAPANALDNTIKGALKLSAQQLETTIGKNFAIIVRSRSYSESESRYIGKERKRGAQEVLFGLIKGKKRADVSIFGNKELFSSTRYVCMLDYDTRPQLNSVDKLRRIAAHPLNKPTVSGGKVVSGYGIIAPHTVHSLESSLKTPFSRFFGGIGSVGAYDGAAQDLYQNLFGRSIFGGKGLIDVDAYCAVCSEKLPKERILSHDTIEGSLMRTAFAGGIVFYESFPSTVIGYFRRQHRWIRGDIQNVPYISNSVHLTENTNPLGFFDKLCIADNLRRAVTPLVLFRLFFFGFVFSPKITGICISAALVSIIFPAALNILSSIFTNKGIFRRYYSAASNKLFAEFSKAAYSLILLPLSALISLDAVAKGFIRTFITHKNLLQWTTAAQTDMHNYSFTSKMIFYAPAEILSLALLFSPNEWVRIFAVFWCISPLIAYFSNKPDTVFTEKISFDRRTELLTDACAMWKYYEDFVVKKYNFLPPDNVQFSPVYRVCERTSPTNIGMYLLSVLSACDFGIIGEKELYGRIENTVSSIEKMEKYNGNLYNWYDIKTLKISPNPFVSSVDSGNFLCCLIAVKETLKAMGNEFSTLCERVALLIDMTDISVFYNYGKNLFSIGINPADGALSPNCYDMLMSEARMLSYFAVAKGIVPQKHWQALHRTMKSRRTYAGAVSYGGTMFEFFMPEILLKSMYGSLPFESLSFCLHCQQLSAAEKNLPYGVSESAYYSFDNELNYRYKAHGVQSCGIKPRLDRECVLAPYATYLAMQLTPFSGIKNLSALKKYGCYGKYGFYEAIDFTRPRADGIVIKSYMAHHVGMSIAALDNILNDGILQRRFLSDSFMRRGAELLEEKPSDGAAILHGHDKSTDDKTTDDERSNNEFIDRFSLENPQYKLLTNGEYTLVADNLGSCVSLWQGVNPYRAQTDRLRYPHGCFFAVSGESITFLPTYDKKGRSAEFCENSVKYMLDSEFFSCCEEVFLHPHLPCEIREFTLKNKLNRPQTLSLCGFIEPSLMKSEDFDAHPAFMKLFVSVQTDAENHVIIVERRSRETDEKLFFAVGFADFERTVINFDREEVLNYPYGVKSAFFKSDTAHNPNYIPDPCVSFREKHNLPPNRETRLHCFILSARSKTELYNGIAVLKTQRDFPRENRVFRPFSPEGRLIHSLLPQLIGNVRDCRENDAAISANTLKTTDLYRFSLNPEQPVITVEIISRSEEAKSDLYIKSHRILRLCGIKFQLVFVFDDINGEIASMLRSRMKHSFPDCEGRENGIFLIGYEQLSDAEKCLIYAVSTHLSLHGAVKMGTPTYDESLIEILPVTNKNTSGNDFTVSEKAAVINDIPPLPWCHVLANPVFGTLLSSTSLGYTFAVNSRENKLTPWNNDPLTDNRGEMLLLRCENGKIYDLCFGSQAEFTRTEAVYRGYTDDFESTVRVSVSSKGTCKKISVSLTKKKAEQAFALTYYTEPVLGADRKISRLIQPEMYENHLLLCNPSNSAVKGFAAIGCSGNFRVCTDRYAFFFGKDFDRTAPRRSLCAAVTTDITGGKKDFSVEFTLSFGHTKKSAVLAEKLFCSAENSGPNIKINTPDKALNIMFNNWLSNQAKIGRIYAKTGFYQNSGAWGFRDQLQDACGLIPVEPQLAKRQIFRACAAQFPEGDVLHWWHNLPDGVKKGVRTRCSDDLLWLTYVTCEYVEKTGDNAVLDAQIRFCKGDLLAENEHEKYAEVGISNEKATVYEHCKRAVNLVISRLDDGLAHIGGGDWNDGFNKIGADGGGTSVWLTEFLVIVLEKFRSAAHFCGDMHYAEGLVSQRQKCINAVEKRCWGNDRYIRAFFSDGRMLGADSCKECKIDSLPQSFAVLADFPDKERSHKALISAYSILTDKEGQLIKLFSPPFSGDDRSAGYITAYPPGVRENGGQYTHAAVWLAAALLKCGESDKGYELMKYINPLSRYENAVVGMRYKTEPYYLCGDVYSNPQAFGRGGWSIYTGAAAWYYRTVYEFLLGIKITARFITFTPSIPSDWDGFGAEINLCGTEISVCVYRNDSEKFTDNGSECKYVPLDGKAHSVILFIKKS